MKKLVCDNTGVRRMKSKKVRAEELKSKSYALKEKQKRLSFKKGEKYMGMKWRVTFSIVPIIALLSIIVLTLIYFAARQSMIDMLDSKLAAESRNVAQSVSVWTESTISKLEVISGVIEEKIIKDDNVIVEYLSSDSNRIEGCTNGAYILYQDGKHIDKTGVSKHPDYVTESWYTFGSSSKEFSFDECSYFEDADTGEQGYSVTIAKQLLGTDGNVEGIIAADADLAGINDMVLRYKSGTGEKIILIDTKSGIVIAATDEKLVSNNVNIASNTFLNDIGNDLANDTMKTRYGNEEGTQFVAKSEVPNTSWITIVYVDRDLALNSLDSILNTSCIGMIVIIILISIVCIRIVGKQMINLEKAKDYIVAITKGDFTMNIRNVKTNWKNEITDINENLNEFIMKMHHVLREVGATKESLADQSEQFTVMAVELNEDAINQSDALGNLTTTMEDMTGTIQTLAEHASDLVSIAQITQQSSIETNGKMDKMVAASVKTSEDIKVVSKEMKKVELSMEDLTELVVKVSEAAGQINSITEVIKGIAKQTNLLSLNASIEAARAGESGRGFAVVANEIKNLAETSAQSAIAIEALITNISALIESTTKSTRLSSEGIRNSAGLLQEANETFDVIMGVVEDTSKVLSKLSLDIRRVDEIATDVAAISEEQAASSEEILASTVGVEELVSRTKEKSEIIKQRTEAIHTVSCDLETEMKFFQV